MVRRLLFSLVVTTLAFLLTPVLVGALEYKEVKDGDFNLAQTIDDDFYVSASENVVIDEEIRGDLFASGGEVRVENFVSGDVYIAAGNVVISDSIGGDVFVASGKATIEGAIQGKLIVAGGVVKIEGEVQGDVIVMAGQVDIDAKVFDDVRVFAGDTIISETVEGDVIAYSGALDLKGDVYGDVVIGSDNANIRSSLIDGDLITYEDSDVTVDDGVSLTGQRIEKQGDIDKNWPTFSRGDYLGIGLVGGLWKFVWNMIQAVGLIILALIVFKLAPVKSDNTLAQMNSADQNMKSFGIGCLAVPAGILIAILLVLSIVGWPVFVVFAACAAIVKVLSTVYVGTKVGMSLMKLVGSNSYTLASIVGILLIQFLTAIPCLGSVLGFFVFFIGVGAILRMYYFNYKDAQTRTVKEEKPKSEKSKKAEKK